MTTPMKKAEQDLAALHRAWIFDFNEAKGWDYVYFRDADIDDPIKPLVDLLNSPWTFTTTSCGGHWEAPPRFQYPYVAFRVMDRPREWRRIMRDACTTLRRYVDNRATVYVSDGYVLPALEPGWVDWRFQPAGSGRFRDSREIFRDERDFRSTLDALIRQAQLALLEAMVKRIG